MARAEFTQDEWRIIHDALTEERHRLMESDKRPAERSAYYAERRSARIGAIESIRERLPIRP